MQVHMRTFRGPSAGIFLFILALIGLPLLLLFGVLAVTYLTLRSVVRLLGGGPARSDEIGAQRASPGVETLDRDQPWGQHEIIDVVAEDVRDASSAPKSDQVRRG